MIKKKKKNLSETFVKQFKKLKKNITTDNNFKDHTIQCVLGVVLLVSRELLLTWHFTIIPGGDNK